MQRLQAIRVLLGSIGQALPCARYWPIALRAARLLTVPFIAGIFCVNAAGNAMTEYQLKAAYLYNFVTFTEWPATVGNTLALCIYGPDPFGLEVEKFQGADVNGRTVALLRIAKADELGTCNIVFISSEVSSNLRRVLDQTDNKPVLTVADSPGAGAAGVSLNMNMEQSKVTFEVNLAAVNSSGLGINFQLLRLAKKVYK